jgi:uncharacterized membrane protein YgdD (TMEM256/DUF423 family)
MKTTMIWAATFGLTAVLLGAFGAHALKAVLTTEQLQSFETGVRYQFYHALLLFILPLTSSFYSEKTIRLCSRLLIIGICLFSGSIYLLNLRELIGVDAIRLLGPITPIGGTVLISAWALLLVNAVRSKK